MKALVDPKFVYVVVSVGGIGDVNCIGLACCVCGFMGRWEDNLGVCVLGGGCSSCVIRCVKE